MARSSTELSEGSILIIRVRIKFGGRKRKKVFNVFVKEKDGLFWVWSSYKASLDCLPQQKLRTIEEVELILQKPTIKESGLYLWAKSLNK